MDPIFVKLYPDHGLMGCYHDPHGGPEIDIFETPGYRTNEIFVDNHLLLTDKLAGYRDTVGWTFDEKTNEVHGINLTEALQQRQPFDFSADFHTYGVAWTPETITWYVDRQPIAAARTQPSARNHALYLAVRLSVLAPENWLRTVTGGGDTSLPDGSQELLIDYIRVYQCSPRAGGP